MPFQSLLVPADLEVDDSVERAELRRRVRQQSHHDHHPDEMDMRCVKDKTTALESERRCTGMPNAAPAMPRMAPISAVTASSRLERSAGDRRYRRSLQ